ncbi:MAG: FAD-binding oxidoreductase [Alphaproteobacteria bacterium]
MNALVSKLSALVSPEQISTAPAYLEELSWDALSESRIHPLHRPERAAPICVVMPMTTEEVRQIVLLANGERIAIVPYGGGSGLMGGALCVRPSIVLDLRRMNKIIEIDGEARSARVQAGIVLEALDQRLNEVGFILGHDPWTVPVATVGGAIATNSVGYRAGIYGSMGEQVLGLQAVLPNGEILHTRGVQKSSAGIDLKALLIGGEGCFGVITEATIRIFPAPEARCLIGLKFDSFEGGYAAIQRIFNQRLAPAVLDFGDDVERLEGGAVLYLGFEGSRVSVDVDAKRALEICERHGARRLADREAEIFWRDRHVIARRFAQNRRERRERGKDGSYRDWIHVALPASKVLQFRRDAAMLIEKHGVRLLESGLWVQPELFSMRLGAEDAGSLNGQLSLQQAIEELLGLAQKMGGSMEYTHGVGVKLAALMGAEHGYGLDIMRQLKKTLDPNNILNPGKMAL